MAKKQRPLQPRARKAGAVLPSTADIEEAIEVLAEMESLAIRRAVPLVGTEVLGQLAEIREELEASWNQPVRWVECHRRFHDLICRHGGGRYLISRIRALRTEANSRLPAKMGHGSIDASLFEHAGLIDAFRRRDALTAGRLARMHIAAEFSGRMALARNADLPQSLVLPRGNSNAQFDGNPKFLRGMN